MDVATSCKIILVPENSESPLLSRGSDDFDEDLTEDDLKSNKSSRLLRKQTVSAKKPCAKEAKIVLTKKIALLLQKSDSDRTEDDMKQLKKYSNVVKEIQSRRRKRDAAKRRLEEFEEPADQIETKCVILAQAIAQAQHLVVYTGAGISTAARIPDYRGTNGIWTRLQQGKEIGNHDLSLAEPTFTHMALSELYKRNILKYVVSQNCDGLHLRSGLPRTVLSEVHGNMYIEVCKTCKPSKEYWRMFDVTENTARYSHKTMRKCYVCNGPLIDSIVHFGERGTLQWPLNWSGASKHARKATTIVCLGSSLKVLKKYPWLWQMDKPVKRRPNLYIINLQWTPKDEFANIKINGKCDQVMKRVMNLLDIKVSVYDRRKDPIFVHGTPLTQPEIHTTTQPFLKDLEPDLLLPLSPPKSPTQPHHEISLIPSPINEAKEKYNYPLTPQKQTDNTTTCDNTIEDSPLDLSPSQLSPTAESSNSSCGLLPSENFLPALFHFSPNLLQLADNYPTIVAYYQLSNTLFGYYPNDLLHYPFQTSFLYSGLHSIINPLPSAAFLNAIAKRQAEEEKLHCQDEIDEEEQKEQLRCEEEEHENIKNFVINSCDPDHISCDFCYDNYKTEDCLFYGKCEAKFVKEEYRYSKLEQIQKPLHCLCCDYTTDEEDGNTSELSKDGMESNSSTIKLDENGSSDTKNKIQPGWFGKGYRKGKRHRK